MLSNLLENGEKCIEKCNFYIKYFDKIACYADRPYLVFSELHIYFFFALSVVLMNNDTHIKTFCFIFAGVILG